MKDGRHFLFTSEMNGNDQLYLYSIDGKEKIQVTKGNHDVTEVNGVDEKNKIIYYTKAWPTPMDRTLFATDFAGQKNYQLSQTQAGTMQNSTRISPRIMITIQPSILPR